MSAPPDDGWRPDPPDKVVDYLFYGDPVNLPSEARYFRPRFELCHVARASNGVIVRVIGGAMCLDGDGLRGHGLWKPLLEAVPDLARCKVGPSDIPRKDNKREQ